MNDTNTIAVAVIRNSEGKYLLITRTEYPDYKDKWGPVAGHVKKNEAIEDALKREVHEELNISISPVKEVTSFPLDIPGFVGSWWICDISSGEVKVNREVEKFGYFSLPEIKKLNLWPATKIFFEKYI